MTMLITSSSQFNMCLLSRFCASMVETVAALTLMFSEQIFMQM